MSAFMVDAGHIDYLVTACRVYQVQYASGATATESAASNTRPNPWSGAASTDVCMMSNTDLGRELLKENLNSVAFRYGLDLTPDELAAPESYEYHRPRLEVTPVQTLKAAQCLEYQSCEHPGWADSLACNILARLTGEATRRLPGMDSALWAISRQSEQAPEGIGR